MVMATKSKWYVVWEGRTPGIYTSWAECKRHVDGFPRAKYKSYPSKSEADAAFSGHCVEKKASAPRKQRFGQSTDRQNSDAFVAVDVEIFCDGACDPNPGPAGSGLAVYRQGVLSSLYYGHYTRQGTNNTAELHALHEALKLAHEAVKKRESVRIRADSSYAIQCVSQWAPGWIKRGWKRSNKEPVKNPEIIAPAHELYKEIADALTLNHVRAHMGIEGNELADRMAMFATKQAEVRFMRYTGELDIAHVLGLQRG
jgi:ribonuclease HI